MFVGSGVSVGSSGRLDPVLMGSLIGSRCGSTGSMLALMDDVCMDVEICEEYEHEDHVTGQQILPPGREIAVEGERISAMTEGDAELDLKLNGQLWNIHVYTHTE